MKLDYRLPLALAGAAILTFSGFTASAGADEPGTIPTDCAELEELLAGFLDAKAINDAADAVISDPASTDAEKAAALASRVPLGNSVIAQTRDALENCIPTPEAPVEEEPAPEAPAEEPVTEEPVTEEPVTEAPVEEGPVAAAPEDDLDCTDFVYQEDAQQAYDADPSDPYGLDEAEADGGAPDGIACESLPSGVGHEVANAQFETVPNTSRGIDTGGL
jgi:hypothetical protein